MRAAILAASRSTRLAALAQRHGRLLGARRFVAGESLDDFLSVASQLNRRGFAVAAGFLGEAVTTREEAGAAAATYVDLLQRFERLRIDANVAFKLTHVGLDIDPELAFEHAARIAQTARECGNTVRLDMESSAYTQATLDLYRRLRLQYDCVGCVLQSYLRRSQSDLESLLELRPNLRIVKGAYLEPASIAFPDKREVDAQYLQLLRGALEAQGYTAIATHDPRIIKAARAQAELLNLPMRGRFEFQMLYGITPGAAEELRAHGYRVRLAVPFGSAWFPYLMRRLAERPANLAFVLRGVLRRG